MFVDTLDNLDWQGATGGAVQRQGAFELGSVSFDNWYRMQAQNEKPISVILGNPPYNAHQANFNEFNPNRAYSAIDQRIKETYVDASTAQKTKQYDMYKRFIRWASDRLADEGIIAFITNRAYIDARQDDGFRKIAAREFSDIYVLDLGSDVRRNPKISGTKHNVFGIQTGVAIGFFVREKAKLGECGIHYAKREDAEIAIDKLAHLDKTRLHDIEFDHITPDKRNEWLNQGNPDFQELLSLADRPTMRANSAEEEQAIFRLYSLGVSTNRDEWVYDFDVRNLRNKALFFADTYNELMDNDDRSYPTKIKWSRDLRNEFRRGRRIVYSEADRIESLYRPFTVKHHFANFKMNDVLTRNHYAMFGTDLQQPNMVICFSGIGSNKPFSVLATDHVYSLDLLEKTQCLPLYRYTEDGERMSNITDWGLQRINAHYRRECGEHFKEVVGSDGITAAAVFAYTYAVLHDPAYREEYKVDLLREFPRLPLYHDWAAWVKMGQELLDLHIGFEGCGGLAAGAGG